MDFKQPNVRQYADDTWFYNILRMFDLIWKKKHNYLHQTCLIS